MKHLLLFISIIFLITACGDSGTDNNNDSKYFKAIVKGDFEFDFNSVNVKVEDFSFDDASDGVIITAGHVIDLKSIEFEISILKETLDAKDVIDLEQEKNVRIYVTITHSTDNAIELFTSTEGKIWISEYIPNERINGTFEFKASNEDNTKNLNVNTGSFKVNY